MILLDTNICVAHLNGDWNGHKKARRSAKSAGLKRPWFLQFLVALCASSWPSGILCILDIAPTLMKLYGLPVPSDMQGKVFV